MRYSKSILLTRLWRWSLKDELFIPRDNSQYKLQTENIEEPIIKTRKWVCRLYDESFNETIYEYTYPDLWIRITTPECWDTVHEYDKSNGVLFKLINNFKY